MLKPKASPLFSPNTMDPEGFCLQGRDPVRPPVCGEAGEGRDGWRKR